MESKIPKEKLKTGKLYKTDICPKFPGQVPLYRVWMGNKWSMGTTIPKNKEWSIYNLDAGLGIQDKIIVVNTKATPFKPHPAQQVGLTSVPGGWFNSVVAKQPKKTIRYLNRP